MIDVYGDPYRWLDATYIKVRQAGRIVTVASTIAMAVNTDGRREVLNMATGASEAETFWTDFLRPLTRRGLRGVKLVISDAHVGLNAPICRVLSTTWQPVPAGAVEHSIFGCTETWQTSSACSRSGGFATSSA